MRKKKKLFCGILALAMMAAPNSVMAATNSGVYAGYSYTVSATAYNNYGSGYGRYVNTAKSLALTVTYSYKDRYGKFRSKVANSSGTTYVSASTPRVGDVDVSSKKTVSSLYIAGTTFTATAN